MAKKLEDYETFTREELLRLLRSRDAEESGGLRFTYKGQTPPWRIVRRVQPRRQRIEAKLSCGSEDEQSCNAIIEGENLQAMVSLYKYRGQVDLILTDPPFNTGEDFRYNDRWDENPNDPDLGSIVPPDDGSRHSKWLRFIVPRAWMMKEMLRPGGVLAICIDHRELFRLGVVLDGIFGEENRLGIINWQKTTVKNDKRHLSSTTEYVLVYAKRQERAATRLLERSEKSNVRFGNPDTDPLLDWKQGDATARGDITHPSMVYAIQSPFDGELHYPINGRHWAHERRRMKAWLEGWGSDYVERKIDDSKAKALLIRGAPIRGEAGFSASNIVLSEARAAAKQKLSQGAWPALYFGHTGLSKPMLKVYLSEVKAGAVPTTFWVEETDEPLPIEAVSWSSAESGRSREGVEELDRIMGIGHGFKTVKPLKLFRKIIQIWCPPTGIVMDPFAGSGTTGHAVLELNEDATAERRFVLIEQGRPERGDSYARSLTAERVRRAITGISVPKNGKPEQCARALPGGFRFSKLTARVDGEAVLALAREEMVDLLLTSHWDQSERGATHLSRLPAGQYTYLFAVSSVSSRNEGFFLIWDGPGAASVLDRSAFRTIVDESKKAGLGPPYHVYAQTAIYPGPNIEFYQIPDRILEKLGFNEASQSYTDDKGAGEGASAK
jgi:adenine-specific DNA-methyltransferase